MTMNIPEMIKKASVRAKKKKTTTKVTKILPFSQIRSLKYKEKIRMTER